MLQEKPQMKKTLLFAPMLLIFFISTSTGQPVYPIKISENGRYFVDQKGAPVFWLGTTQWEIFRQYTLDEARMTIESVRENGFSFMLVMLMGVGEGTKPNVYGEKPWKNDDPLSPNEAYFAHVDSVIQIARENNIIISLTPYHQRYRKSITINNARAWAKWVGLRYRDVPNIFWSLVPEAKEEYVPVMRELAAGLAEGDGGVHLISVEPDPAPYSSSFIHDEEWLDFNTIQTWKSVELIYPMVTRDYNLKPVKPVLMAEGAYEEGSEYGFAITPLWVRRQAYYSYLAGGHHAYGHNDSWRVLPTWKAALRASGARQMGILKKIFLARKEWWNLVPDQSIFAAGGNVEGQILNMAARHSDGAWAMVYLGSEGSVSIHMNKIVTASKVDAFWFDPRTGESSPAGSFPDTGVQAFSTPDGWEVALLVLEATDKRK